MDDAPEQSTAVLVENDYRLTVERSSEGSVIRLLDGAGGEPLRITFRPEGPVLQIGTGLAIHVAGELSFAAERVAFHGREGIELTTGGDMLVRCDGDLISEAREQRLSARLGDVRVEANDDVKLLGERIRLNC
jgi:hypothetical protein